MTTRSGSPSPNPGDLDHPGHMAAAPHANSRLEDLEIEKKKWRLAGFDPNKFDYFFDKYHDRIFEYAFWRTGNPDIAADMTSEVFPIAWDRRSQFRWQGYSFGAWLFRIARTVASHHIRRVETRAETRFRPEIHAGTSETTAADKLATKSDQEILHQYLSDLKPEQYEAIVMHYFMGMTAPQISLVTGAPTATVNSHLRRGKLALRNKLGSPEIRGYLSPKTQLLLRQADLDASGLHLAPAESNKRGF